MRILSYVVMLYMLLGIIWWGMLLYSRNQEIYDLRTELVQSDDPQAIYHIEQERSRQSNMIIGEGIVLGMSLIAGLWFIHKSAQKEIMTAKLQRNFLLSISHELKTPLASLKLSIQTLLKRDQNEDLRRELLQKGLSDTERLELLVQNILLSASIDEDKLQLLKESFDLNKVIQNCIDKYNRLYNRQNIQFDSIPEQVFYSGDKLAFDMVISNLVENAIKYSNKDEAISINLVEENGQIRITIKDQGIGIEQEDHLKVFDRFYRSSNHSVRSKTGTGLGLFLVKEIIEAHRGEIRIVESSSKGTTFEITLPVDDVA